jgi:hypothetical protein
MWQVMEKSDGQRTDEKQQGTEKAQEAESGGRGRKLRELCIVKATHDNQEYAVCKAREVKISR